MRLQFSNLAPCIVSICSPRLFDAMIRCWATTPTKRPPFSRLHNDLSVLKTVTLATKADVSVVLAADGTLRSCAGGKRWGMQDLPDSGTAVDDKLEHDDPFDLYSLPDPVLSVGSQSKDYVSAALLRMLAAGSATEAQVAAARRPAILKRDDVQMNGKIGAGQFGEVWSATMSRAPDCALATPVAVKKLTPKATVSDARDLVDEAILMAQVSWSFR